MKQPDAPEIQRKYAQMAAAEFASLTREDLSSEGQIAYDREVERRNSPEWLASEAKIQEAYTKTMDAFSNIPWYRRSAVNSFLILVNVLTGGLVPGILLVSIIVLTGDVYYYELDETGHVKTWSRGNKVTAIILLLINIAVLSWFLSR